MCYAKPAPRCSTHARHALRQAASNLKEAEARVIEAKAEYEASNDLLALAKMEAVQRDLDLAEQAHADAKQEYELAAEQKKQAYAEYKKAQQDFALTPAGIEAIRAKGQGELADKLAIKRQHLIDLANRKDSTPTLKTEPQLDPRVSAILGIPVELDERGRVVPESKEAMNNREAAVKELLESGDKEAALTLIEKSHLPREILAIARHYHRNRRRTHDEKVAHMESHPDLAHHAFAHSHEAIRNPEIMVAAINSDTHRSLLTFKSDYFNSLTQLQNPSLSENPEIRKALESKIDSLPRDPEDDREDRAIAGMKTELARFAYLEKVQPKVDALTALGGNEWVKDDLHRVYFENENIVNRLGGKYESLSNKSCSIEFPDGSKWVGDKSDFAKLHYDLKKEDWGFSTHDDEIRDLFYAQVKKANLF